METELTPTWSLYTSTTTSSFFMLQTTEQSPVFINTGGSNKKLLELEETSIFDGKMVKDPIIDPFKMALPSNDSGNISLQTSFYLSRTLIIPATITMVLCSITLMYIILRHLKAIIKLYLSVLFYAISILYFASQITTKLLYNQVSENIFCFQFTVLKFLIN
jgi:hypothetical protein